MGHGHFHGPRGDARPNAGSHRRALGLALALTAGYLVVQAVTAVATGSLSLLSDAGHMATDVVGLAMAFTAMRLAATARPHPRRTFGLYRLEILAALGNAALMFAIAGYVVMEALRRLGNADDIDPVSVLLVGTVGLAVNAVSLVLLREGAAENLNVRGAASEVMADLAGSVGVVVGAAVMWATGWSWVDPVVGVAIAVFIVPRAWSLGAQALRVLLQAAPRDVDLAAVRADLCAIPGVVDVHDLHVWTLTSDMDVATAHVMIGAGTDAHGVLDQARSLLSERHGLHHATLQVEPDDHRGCDDVSW
jgi:cobalt-zinc-cadmium efflux system protein